MTASPSAQTFVIPEEPDWPRMRRETSARLRSAMADNGVDALLLLMNDTVVYATGASWPVLDAGLSHVERPVAVVLAADEHPHLFLPFREGAASESQVPPDHLHGPLYLELEEGVEHRPAGTRGVHDAVVHQQDQRVNAVVGHGRSKPGAGFATHPRPVRLVRDDQRLPAHGSRHLNTQEFLDVAAHDAGGVVRANGLDDGCQRFLRVAERALVVRVVR